MAINLSDLGSSGGEFKGVDLSSAGATHTMDLSQGNYFDGGELTQDTTLAFSNVPQSAKWTYSALLSTTANIIFPSSVLDDNLKTPSIGERATYEFTTTDSGISVSIVDSQYNRPSSSVIKSIQRGVSYIRGQSTSVSFSPVNLEKSSIRITGQSLEDANVRLFCHMSTVSEGSFVVYRQSNTTSVYSDTHFTWEVIEYV